MNSGLLAALAVAFGLCAPSALAFDEDPLVVPAVVREPFTGDLPEIRKRGILRALVSPSRTDFFLEGARPRGILVEKLGLVGKAMAAGREVGELPVVFKYVIVPFRDLIPALIEGRGDVVVANLTVTPEREAEVAFARDKAGTVDELVVVHRSIARDVNSLADLAGRTVHVLAASSYAEHLRSVSLGLVAKGLAPVRIVEAHPLLATEDILELVNARVVAITVADDYRARVWEKVLPNVEVRADVQVNSGGTLGWAVRKDNPELLRALRRAMGEVRTGTLAGNTLIKRYYGDARWIRNPLRRGEREKLEGLAGLFEKYAVRYELDPLIIAAQGYQESKLNQNLRSPAGAVGVMQMLPSTAADPNVGIPDIGTAENNIHAAARYMAFLRDRYFSEPSLDEADRIAFALAAYNAGPAKVRRMREKAQAVGLDPDRWFGHTEYGAMALVGRETVRYVRNVFKYYLTYRSLSTFQVQRDDAKKAASGG